MPTPLPNQLAYLAPVITELEEFDPGSLGDDNPDAMDFVESAVRSRLRGRNETDARTTVEEDGAALGRWVQSGVPAPRPI